MPTEVSMTLFLNFNAYVSSQKDLFTVFSVTLEALINPVFVIYQHLRFLQTFLFLL